MDPANPLKSTAGHLNGFGLVIQAMRLMLYFFPRVFLYNIFLNFAHLWWFGVRGFVVGVLYGVFGVGFSVDGACGVWPSGFFGLGLFI